MSGLTTEDTEGTEARTWAAEAAGLLTVLGSYQSGALGEQIEACLARYQQDAGMIERLRSALDLANFHLSGISRWIERRHPDGVIDSLTYLQNLERVTDGWYDRLDRMEADARRFVRERDEAREAIIGWENKWKCAVEMAARAELERDEAREALREIEAADWKTSGELRGMARKVLEAGK